MSTERRRDHFSFTRGIINSFLSPELLPISHSPPTFIAQRKESTHRINQLKADIIEEDYFLESSTKEYDQIMEKQQRITRMLAGLENDYSKVAAKAKALKEERVAIENQVSPRKHRRAIKAKRMFNHMSRFMQLIGT